MADDTDGGQALLTALTTEHFTLQGARSQTVGESAARSALYMSSVSSTLIALGFVSQASPGGEVFQLFALAVLPTLFFLGLFTFARLVQSSIEDVRYGRAINRIRHYYLEMAGESGRYFQLSSHDDPRGVLVNMGLEGGSRWQLFFGTANAVGVVNSVVGAGAIAILLASLSTFRSRPARWRAWYSSLSPWRCTFATTDASTSILPVGSMRCSRLRDRVESATREPAG